MDRPEHKTWKNYYASQGFAFMVASLDAYVHRAYHYDTIKMWLGDIVFTALSEFATSSGHEELQFAPLFVNGHSNGGLFAIGFSTNYPERVLGFIASKGSFYGNIPSEPSAYKAPGMIISGEFDTIIRPRYPLAGFCIGREYNAPWCHILEPGGEHKRIFDSTLVLPFFRSVVKKRFPESWDYKSIPYLNPIITSNGWYGDNSSYEIYSHECFRKDTNYASWLIDRENALIWQQYVSNNTVDTFIADCADNYINTKYFGQAPPKDAAEIFAPGIISVLGRDDLKYEIKTDDKEALLSTTKYKLVRLNTDQLVIDLQKEDYANAVILDSLPPKYCIDGIYGEFLEGTYSTDGNTIFLKRKNRYCNDNYTGYHSSMAVRTNNVFSAPSDFELNLSSLFNVSFTNNNMAYFNYANNYVIRKALFVDGEFTNCTTIGKIQGSQHYISKTADYLLCVINSDIYVIFIDENDILSEPINLGPKVNTNNIESYPTLSPDGKFMFFNRRNSNSIHSDIYWVGTHIIDQAKTNVSSYFITYVSAANINVYPTRVKDNLYIENTDYEELDVKIYALTGALVKHERMNNKHNQTINVSELVRGTYYIKIVADNYYTTTKKLIIE